MIRKSLLTSLLILAFSLIAFGQMAPLRGRVEMLQEDGKTKVPVAGAVVEVFRTDIKAGFPSAKTDKKGYFSFAGLPLGATFLLSISATGASPDIYPNVKAGREDISIVLNPGDGKKLTEDEARAYLSRAKTQGPTGELSAEEKKKLAEEQKKIDEVNAKNARTKEADEIARKSFDEALKALNSKDYNLALSKVEEGITAVPDFAGSTPILLNIKGTALKDRGFLAYKQGTDKGASPELKASKFQEAKNDWLEAIVAYNRGLEILKNASASLNSSQTPEDQKNNASRRLNLLTNRIEIYRLLVISKIDETKAADALTAYHEYIDAEPEPAKKATAQSTLADILRHSGDCDNATTEYRKVLELSPDNPDAMAGLGLCLFNIGVVNSDKAKMQDGLNYMSKFAETAPDTHPLKSSVKDAVEYLKNQEKLAPQKLPKAGATPKKKP